MLKKTYLSAIFLGIVGRLGVEMTVVLKLKKEMDFKFGLAFNRVFMFSSIVIPHHQILYFASQRALPVKGSAFRIW